MNKNEIQTWETAQNDLDNAKSSESCVTDQPEEINEQEDSTKETQMRTYTIVFHIDGEETGRKEGLSLKQAQEYAKPWEGMPATFYAEIFDEHPLADDNGFETIDMNNPDERVVSGKYSKTDQTMIISLDGQLCEDHRQGFDYMHNMVALDHRAGNLRSIPESSVESMIAQKAKEFDSLDEATPEVFWRETEDEYNDIMSTESVFVKKDVGGISSCFFKDLPNLKHVELEDGIQVIGDGVFANDQNLESVIIPDSVLFIGENVFSGCRNLKDVQLPKCFESQKDDILNGKSACRYPHNRYGMENFDARDINWVMCEIFYTTVENNQVTDKKCFHAFQDDDIRNSELYIGDGGHDDDNVWQRSLYTVAELNKLYILPDMTGEDLQQMLKNSTVMDYVHKNFGNTAEVCLSPDGDILIDNITVPESFSLPERLSNPDRPMPQDENKSMMIQIFACHAEPIEPTLYNYHATKQLDCSFRDRSSSLKDILQKYNSEEKYIKYTETNEPTELSDKWFNLSEIANDKPLTDEKIEDVCDSSKSRGAQAEATLNVKSEQPETKKEDSPAD